jgi:hypothetical protein
MDSSVLIALITAITSIVVALIQMTVSLRVASLKESLSPTQSKRAPKKPKTSTKTVAPYRTWLGIGTILIISNIVLLFWFRTEMAIPAQIGAVVWCTCLLAYFRPIQWAYVAGIVALINGILLSASFLYVGQWRSEDIVFVSSFYVANAILATAISYLRMRNSETR